MKHKLQKLNIDRSRWACGSTRYENAPKDEGQTIFVNSLLNSDGSQCCLGFWATAMGAAPDAIRNVPYPHRIKDGRNYQDIPNFDEEYTFQDVGGTNDDEGLSVEEREQAVRRLFDSLLLAAEVEFIGEYNLR